MAPSAELAFVEAEKHVREGLQRLKAESAEVQELRTRAGDCFNRESAQRSEIAQLKEEVAALKEDRAGAVAEALKQSSSNSAAEFDLKVETEITLRMPAIFDAYLRKMISDEEFAALQPLSRLVLMHDARESVLMNSIEFKAAPHRPKQNLYLPLHHASFPTEHISFAQDEEATIAILKLEVKAQLAAADEEEYFDLLGESATRQVVRLSGRKAWFHISGHKFLKLDGCEVYVKNINCVLFLPWGVKLSEWKQLPAGTMLLKQGANGDELVIKLGGNGSEDSLDGRPKLVCVKTMWVLDIEKELLGFIKRGATCRKA
jgi:hypothetical protein